MNLTSENPQPIVPGVNVEFTYSVRWAPSPIAYSRRFERYLDYNFFEHQARAPLCLPCITAPCCSHAGALHCVFAPKDVARGRSCLEQPGT